MALLTHTIPNLMNGVSQQPITIRLSNQAEEQINATCRVSDGLSKRLAVEMLRAERIEVPESDPVEFITLSDTTTKMHTVSGVDASGVPRVIQLLLDCTSGLLTYRHLESPYTSGVIGTFEYLENSVKEDIKFLTDADTTYILNRGVAVLAVAAGGDAPETAMRRQGSMGWVKQGYFGTTYTLTTRIADAVTGADVVAATSHTYTTNSSSTTTTLTELETTNIANSNSGTLGLGKKLDDYVANVANTYYNTHLEVVRADNWFILKFKSGSAEATTRRIEMKVTSSTAETAAFAANGVIKDPVQLPRTSSSGYTVKVDADPTQPGDHYYLSYSTESFGWVESKQLGLTGTIDSDTLPIIVTGLIEGSVSSEQLAVADREVGDIETCPDPSFVGHTINDMFIFNNRLGFLSKNNVIMSRIDEFNVFYRTSTAVSLAADRVDVKAAVPSSRYTDLNAAVTFETALLMFGDAAQYVLNTNTGFDLTKTSLQSSTEYEASKISPPINVGSSVYFAATRGNYSAIFDLSRKDGIGLTAEEATHHIPTYINGRVNEVAFSSTENIFFARTYEDKRTIYVQNRFIRNTVLEQNAWHKWTVPNDILYITAQQGKLYICMVAEDGITLIRTFVDIATLRINQDEESLVLDFKPHLDYLQLIPQGTVLSIDDIDAIYYIPEEHEESIVGVALDGGQVFGLDDINTALEDADMWVGVPFTFSYTFSEQVPAEQGDGSKTVYQYGRLVLRSMKISYFNSGKFDVKVTPTGRDTFITKFTGTILGSISSLLGRINVSTGVFKFPVNCRSNEVTITIESSYPYPCTFNTCEWQGMFTNNSGRM